ncbi:unnamed protein product [Lota lota]
MQLGPGAGAQRAMRGKASAGGAGLRGRIQLDLRAGRQLALEPQGPGRKLLLGSWSLKSTRIQLELGTWEKKNNWTQELKGQEGYGKAVLLGAGGCSGP